MNSESVMVVRTEALAPLLRGRNANLIGGPDAAAVLDLIAQNHTFLERPAAEVAPEWRQIIPYVIVTNGDRVFTLQRTTRQTEARLHHKISIGIGGHINPGHDLRQGLQKELDEEVAIAGTYSLAFAGILNDETTEVGRVHLGAVYLASCATADVRVLETEKMAGEWRTRAELLAVHESMETWSQIAFDALLR